MAAAEYGPQDGGAVHTARPGAESAWRHIVFPTSDGVLPATGHARGTRLDMGARGKSKILERAEEPSPTWRALRRIKKVDLIFTSIFVC